MLVENAGIQFTHLERHQSRPSSGIAGTLHTTFITSFVGNQLDIGTSLVTNPADLAMTLLNVKRTHVVDFSLHGLL